MTALCLLPAAQYRHLLDKMPQWTRAHQKFCSERELATSFYTQQVVFQSLGLPHFRTSSTQLPIPSCTAKPEIITIHYLTLLLHPFLNLVLTILSSQA